MSRRGVYFKEISGALEEKTVNCIRIEKNHRKMAEKSFWEIERKYLIKGDFSRNVISSIRMEQGYICDMPGRTVRVRIAGDRGWLTIKGESRDGGVSRFEWEKEIPVEEARQLMELAVGTRIEKIRYLADYRGQRFEIDVFEGENRGLVVAELELPSPDTPVEKPSWLGREVTGERRYYNSQLISNPYCRWEL